MNQNQILAFLGAIILGGGLAYVAMSQLQGPPPEPPAQPEPDASPTPPKPPAPSTPDASPEQAAAPDAPEELLKTHCARCHVSPSPEHLPKEVWPFVMRWMGNYLGIPSIGPDNERLVQPAFVPKEQLVSEDAYKRLERWLVERARPQAEMRIARDRAPVTARFTPKRLQVAGDVELLTLLHVDEGRQRLLVGGGKLDGGPRLRSYTLRGEQDWEVLFRTEPIVAEPREGGYRIATIGALDMDRGNGRIVDLTLARKGPPSQAALLSGAHRLTHIVSRDLDGDGREDLVAVEFGDGYGPPGRGRLSVLWATPRFEEVVAKGAKAIPTGPLSGALEQTTLMAEAGPLNVVVDDFNGDGREDIALARAQGYQQIIVWLNLGERRFERRVVKEWFASFGLNRMRAADFDGDGDRDLLVVSGNNMEIPAAPLRPYHGLRVLENEGELRFTERFVYPFYGGLDAVVRDFDNDGDPDVAAISLFPDWDAPEMFVYLENEGGFAFSASGLAEADFGQWLSIGAGDVNGDGAPDILLGSTRMPLGLVPDKASARISASPPVLVLENNP